MPGDGVSRQTSLIPFDPSHDDLVQRSVRWLRTTMKCGIVYAEIVTCCPITPDAIGWYGNWSILVECKRSRSDFRADRKKPHLIDPNAGPGQERWYLTPPGLVRPEEVPEEWGLAEVHPKSVRKVKQPSKGRGGEFFTPFVCPHTGAERTYKSRERILIPERAMHEIDILRSVCRRHECGAEWQNAGARFRALQ